MRDARRGAVGVLFLVAVMGFWIGHAAAEDVVPELDIVVTAKVLPATLPKTHGEALIKAVYKDVRESFFRLVSPNAPIRVTDPLKDGEAKVRMFVDYATTINCGSQISMKMDKTTGANGGDFFVKRWYLPFDQKATVTVRLAKWAGDKYEDVVKFTVPVPKNDRELRDGAVTQVAERPGRAGNKDAESNECPVKIDEARTVALRNSIPGPLRATLYSKLVPITLVKAATSKMDGGKVSELQIELKVENKSAWPLKRAEFSFTQGGVGFMAGDERGIPGNSAFALPEVLAPGQTATVKTTAKVHLGGLGQGTQSADFETGAPQ